MTDKPKTNANARSLGSLRRDGWRAEVCEQFKARVEGEAQKLRYKGGFRKDLFGFADLFAFTRTRSLFVQTTTTAQIRPHLLRYRRDPAIAAAIVDWLAGSGRGFQIHGWERVMVKTKDPKAKNAWRPEWRLTVYVVRPGDFGAAEVDGEPKGMPAEKRRQVNDGIEGLPADLPC